MPDPWEAMACMLAATLSEQRRRMVRWGKSTYEIDGALKEFQNFLRKGLTTAQDSTRVSSSPQGAPPARGTQQER